MRPDELFPLFAHVDTIKGIGKGSCCALQRLFRGRAGEETNPSNMPIVRDLLFHLPVSLLDRRASPLLTEAQAGQVVTILLKADRHTAPSSRRAPYKITCSNDSGTVELAFFNADPHWVSKQFPFGAWRAVSGKLELFDGRWQMPHPDVIAPAEEIEKLKTVDPIYPLTAGLSSLRLHGWIKQVVSKLPRLPEWHDAGFMGEHNFPRWHEALKQVHNPQNADNLSPYDNIRRRLAADEILADQLALAILRQDVVKDKGEIIPLSALSKKIESQLSFALTQGQQAVLQEIRDDMSSGHRMLRLLQGDVGSGKTIVALLAMLDIVGMGAQAVCMAPTEILARQHFASFSKMLEPFGIKPVLVRGGMRSKERAEVLADIVSGEAKIIVGTHALFQEGVVFQKLSLVVIDEQHRFGVLQRMALANKGTQPHLLLMTATPIPRSLSMMLYGDLENSQLKEKPAGRQEIITRALPVNRAEEVINSLQRNLISGTRAYWICPLVEEKEEIEENTLPIMAVEERYRILCQFFPGKVGLVHGKMKAAERQQVMQAFKDGELSLLVATTVIEVGVDVPEATIIIIENAERFGLAQLHQLRGRVGRGNQQSSCLLLYQPFCSNVAKERLKVMREHNDGFLISEEDLRLRGGGEVLGTRQSGVPEFVFADLFEHKDLIEFIRIDVKNILARDPKLESPRGQALRVLLSLFGHDRNVGLLGAG